jgi:hypothetical protein
MVMVSRVFDVIIQIDCNSMQCKLMGHIQQKKLNDRFEVLTAVVMKRSVFWDVMQYTPVEVN